MKFSLYFSIIASLLVSIIAISGFGISPTYAQNATNSTSTTNSLTINMVKPTNAKTIELVFSDAIDISTLRVSIENQNTKSSVSISSYESGTSTNTAKILLGSDLSNSTAYKLTVNSVMGLNNQTIGAWVDAIREFITPASFATESVVPTSSSTTNTSATLASTQTNSWALTTSSNSPNTTTTTTSTKTTMTNSGTIHSGATNTSSGNSVPVAKELPKTGSEIFILLWILGLLGAMFIIKSPRTKA